MNKLHFFHFLILVFFCSSRLVAGWVIVSRHNSHEGFIRYETLTIEGQMVKSASLKGTIVYDLQSDNIALIFDKESAYWRGNVFDFRVEMDSAVRRFVDAFANNLPENSIALYAPLLEDMKTLFSVVPDEYLDTLKIEIEETNENPLVAGYSCIRYLVRVNKNEIAQAWISPELKNTMNLDGKKLAHFRNQTLPLIQGETHFDKTKAYLSLWDKGFMLKSLDKSGNATEVIKVVEQWVAPEEFAIPKGYRKISIDEIIQKQLLQGENEIDTREGEVTK